MARINLSHGTQKANLQLLSKFKQAKRLRPYMNCALMVEIRGREVRMSQIADKAANKDGKLRVPKGTTVTLVSGQYEQPSDATTFRINNEEIQRYVKPHDQAYIDDGKLVAEVTSISEQGVQVEVKWAGGPIQSCAAVRFIQGKHANLPITTEADIADLSAISQMCFIDFLTVPFATQGDDIAAIRKTLGENGKAIHILAKVDQLESVQRFNEILEEADGAVFARSELQLEPDFRSPAKLMLA